MSIWASTVICVLLLQNGGPSEEPPRPLVVTKKDWNITQAYIDVFKILSDQNTCSDFYR